MGDPAKSLDDERFERLLRALERLVLVEERKLAQVADSSRRAAKKAGPTTEQAMAQVKARLKKVRSK